MKLIDFLRKQYDALKEVQKKYADKGMDKSAVAIAHDVKRAGDALRAASADEYEFFVGFEDSGVFVRVEPITAKTLAEAKRQAGNTGTHIIRDCEIVAERVAGSRWKNV